MARTLDEELAARMRERDQSLENVNTKRRRESGRRSALSGRGRFPRTADLNRGAQEFQTNQFIPDRRQSGRAVFENPITNLNKGAQDFQTSQFVPDRRQSGSVVSRNPIANLNRGAQEFQTSQFVPDRRRVHPRGGRLGLEGEVFDQPPFVPPSVQPQQDVTPDSVGPQNRRVTVTDLNKGANAFNRSLGDTATTDRKSPTVNFKSVEPGHIDFNAVTPDSTPVGPQQAADSAVARNAAVAAQRQNVFTDNPNDPTFDIPAITERSLEEQGRIQNVINTSPAFFGSRASNALFGRSNSLGPNIANRGGTRFGPDRGAIPVDAERNQARQELRELSTNLAAPSVKSGRSRTPAPEVSFEDISLEEDQRRRTGVLNQFNPGASAPGTANTFEPRLDLSQPNTDIPGSPAAQATLGRVAEGIGASQAQRGGGTPQQQQAATNQAQFQQEQRTTLDSNGFARAPDGTIILPGENLERLENTPVDPRVGGGTGISGIDELNRRVAIRDQNNAARQERARVQGLEDAERQRHEAVLKRNPVHTTKAERVNATA